MEEYYKNLAIAIIGQAVADYKHNYIKYYTKNLDKSQKTIVYYKMQSIKKFIIKSSISECILDDTEVFMYNVIVACQKIVKEINNE